jgi:hypothetical protein
MHDARRTCLGAALLLALSLTATATAGAAPASAAATASAAAARSSISSSSDKRPALLRQGHGRSSRRVGGRVRRAWPATGRAPHRRLNRWLARQVGAATPLACAKQRRKARARCHLGKASAAAAVALPLQLVRSYEIPADDPSYTGLINWSWTYDSAVAAEAFASTGDQANAGQLLDQLAALQHPDGSTELAFNTASGEASSVVRAGAIAWVGLADATYDRAFGSSRYLPAERRAADYLLSLRTTAGLIRGGPDVTWASTEHNLVAYAFLARLGHELQAAGQDSDATTMLTAAGRLSAAIDAQLLVSDAGGTRFLEGADDTTQALDVQALGAMYLQGTGRSALATATLAYAHATFPVDARSVALSSDLSTFNLTYAAAGPFAGYRPYAGPGAPDVLWAEGGGEMRVAEAQLGQSTRTADRDVARWAAITAPGNLGPLQADRTVTSTAYGVQYHVWPASTAAAWTVLSTGATDFLVAQPPVDLGSAADYAVLAGSTITSAGVSAVDGSLGLSPGTSVTGFPPGTTTGAVRTGAAAAAAKADLETAWTDAASRGPAVPIAGDLGGRTLTAGVYASGSSIGLTGTLTLDAQGDPNAAFVIRAGSTLITAAGSQVRLAGGAQACNVTWQVGSSATLGASSALAGNVLATASITAGDGVTVQGRLLARAAAVTLIGDAIAPTPCAGGGSR